jgi:hypothetical protein
VVLGNLRGEYAQTTAETLLPGAFEL